MKKQVKAKRGVPTKAVKAPSQKKAFKRADAKSPKKTGGNKAKKKAVYRKSTDKVGDILVNQAGVKYKITGERYAPPSGYDDGKLKIRMLEITPEKKTGIKPFETNDVTLKYYRDKRFLTRVKR